MVFAVVQQYKAYVCMVLIAVRLFKRCHLSKKDYVIKCTVEARQAQLHRQTLPSSNIGRPQTKVSMTDVRAKLWVKSEHLIRREPGL